jgi:hypothetical protein
VADNVIEAGDIVDPRWHLEIMSFPVPKAVYGQLSRRLYRPVPGEERTWWSFRETSTLERLLTADEAVELSKVDQFPWQADDGSSRFDSAEAVTAAALLVFGRVSRPGDFLELKAYGYDAETELLAGNRDGYVDPAPKGIMRMGFGTPRVIDHDGAVRTAELAPR